MKFYTLVPSNVLGAKLFNALTSCTLLLLITAAVHAGTWDELDQASRDKLLNGEQVLSEKEVPGSSWPEFTIYQRVIATSEEGAAVFSDYDRHSTYFAPDLTKSVSRVIDRVTKEVDYSLNLGYFGLVENYTVRNVLETYPVSGQFPGKGYKITWTQLSAGNSKSSDGYASFEPLEDGMLLTYKSLVVPNRWGAGMMVDRARTGVKTVAEKLAKQITTEKNAPSGQPENILLLEQLGKLKEALGEQ